ncbi:ABC transporter ATP-binding protein [Microbacterium marinilacus]|uniref:ABC transporter ATP-binding protein n=1 Tax=Microbacterium marinilacus TaxID=415209 RepID=A0ABP7BR51_9MICO|nr:ABC transporter ATP-binding protein [Microbacterium marinilacus]MBY0690467.1 ABC transporter ATP-binding protein/permease [Microbacterium marinilacus]
MIRRLLRIMGDEAGRLRLLVTLTVIGAIIQGVAFALLVPLMQALLEGRFTDLWWWVGVEAAILLAFGAVTYSTKLLGLSTSFALTGRLWRRLGDHISTLPLGWFNAEKVGSVSRLLSVGVFSVTGFPTQVLGLLIHAFVTPAVVVALMFVFQWQLALIAVATVPFLWLAYRWSGALLRAVDRRTHGSNVRTANRLIEFAQTQPVLRAFGRTAEGYQLLDDALVAQHKADNTLMTWGGVVGDGIFRLTTQAAFTAILLGGVALAAGNAIGPVQLVALLILATRFIQPLMESAAIGGAIKSMGNNLSRMDAVFDVHALPEPEQPAALADASVEFHDVRFGYDDREVLSGVSFVARPRTMTALAGPSGSGKTTITRLIARFWDTQSGSVTVSGSDVRRMTAEQLMGQLSFVFQDVYLFSGTIRENIMMARPDATEEQLHTAVRLARVTEITDRLPLGLDTAVGEGGNALSGGERQRVSIARALLKDAPIVLLDEATAALDAENEALVQEALTALTANRTLIVIAHRLQTIAAADQILFLEDGAIAERGTHEELLHTDGRYADFWRERSRARGWRLGTRS